MTGFALHRVVIDSLRADPERRSLSGTLQLQVSTDGGETWYAVVTSGGLSIKSSKDERARVAVELPLFEFDGGAFGAIVEGEFIEWSADSSTA